MATYFYDEALVEKLKSWRADTQLQILGPDETRRLFEVIADNTKDEPIKLPIVCLTRRSGYSILSTGKKPMTFDGLTKEATVPHSMQINAIPISLSYQIDVYTRYYKEADEFARNIIFNIINSPSIEIVLPYNSVDLVHKSNIRIASEVEDNSNIAERLVPGQFTRLTFVIDIDDAYLFDLRFRHNYIIEANVEY